MRGAFVHDALVSMPENADHAAPGAAVTLELCGGWQHEPPCPLAPHHTSAVRAGGAVRIRTVFAVEPDREDLVRRRIELALTRGHLRGPNGVTTEWRTLASAPGSLSDDEARLARRLIAS